MANKHGRSRALIWPAKSIWTRRGSPRVAWQPHPPKFARACPPSLSRPSLAASHLQHMDNKKGLDWSSAWPLLACAAIPHMRRQPPPPFFRVGLYSCTYLSCTRLMAPRLFLRIRSTVSSQGMPDSMSAMATSSGALPSPATQWTAMVQSDEKQRSSQRAMSEAGGASPSGKFMSCTWMPSACTRPSSYEDVSQQRTHWPTSSPLVASR
mmetsp:Transcript_11565/g.35786  ORF Transcript_11565/g.35786 Transcript_11565/m.35786 type:complete len:209 (+) Transcript_11565:614-1240(+)